MSEKTFGDWKDFPTSPRPNVGLQSIPKEVVEEVKNLRRKLAVENKRLPMEIVRNWLRDVHGIEVSFTTMRNAFYCRRGKFLV